MSIPRKPYPQRQKAGTKHVCELAQYADANLVNELFLFLSNLRSDASLGSLMHKGAQLASGDVNRLAVFWGVEIGGLMRPQLSNPARHRADVPSYQSSAQLLTPMSDEDEPSSAKRLAGDELALSCTMEKLFDPTFHNRMTCPFTPPASPVMLNPAELALARIAFVAEMFGVQSLVLPLMAEGVLTPRRSRRPSL